MSAYHPTVETVGFPSLHFVSYEIVDNGQNIKFEIGDSRYRDKIFYTSMSNVELVYRDNNVDYGTDYTIYPGNASKFGKGGK